MRSYGSCMVVLPDNPGELAGGDSGRLTRPAPDEFGGQIDTPRTTGLLDQMFDELRENQRVLEQIQQIDESGFIHEVIA